MSNIIRCFVHPNDSRNHCAGSSCVEYSVLHEKTNISFLPKSARGHRALPEKILDVTFFLGF